MTNQINSIIIGCDFSGKPLLDTISAHLNAKGIEVIDIGSYPGDLRDYPDIAEELALRVAKGEFERGILICGTGIGMAIAANKIPGVRAACCHDPYSAERSRKSNNAQIITMGALVIGNELAISLIDIWLNSEFQGGRSEIKVKKLEELDMKFKIR